MSDKSRYLARVRSATTIYANLLDDLSSLRNAYFDRSYAPAAADEITSGEAEAQEMTLAEISAFVNMVGAIEALNNNQAPAQDDWGAVVSWIRNDL